MKNYPTLISSFFLCTFFCFVVLHVGYRMETSVFYHALPITKSVKFITLRKLHCHYIGREGGILNDVRDFGQVIDFGRVEKNSFGSYTMCKILNQH